jgi:hypothetical protein
LGQYSSQSAPPTKKLGIILQGPFGVVVRNYDEHRITAFVPKTSQTDRLEHEFRFLSPNREPLEPCSAAYQFELQQKGLRTAQHSATIDRGFDDVRFPLKKWVPDPDNYFVMLDLPHPDNITFIPPIYPALFESGQQSGERFGSAPLNYVLEYTVEEADSIRVNLKQGMSCSGTQDHPPLSSRELQEEYERYEHGTRDQAEVPFLSQRLQINHWLSQYSHLYFFGVGLHPYMGHGPMPPDRLEHGVNFFNNKLLPAIHQDQTIPPGAKLKTVGMNAFEHATMQSETPSIGLRQAIWNRSIPQARFRTVSSPENCTSPVVVGTTTTG